MYFSSKATPTNNADTTTVVILLDQSYRVNIVPLIWNSLGGGHTDIHTYTCIAEKGKSLDTWQNHHISLSIAILNGRD